MNIADRCRANGWVAGTVVKTDIGLRTITHIGKEMIVAITDRGDEFTTINHGGMHWTKMGMQDPRKNVCAQCRRDSCPTTDDDVSDAKGEGEPPCWHTENLRLFMDNGPELCEILEMRGKRMKGAVEEYRNENVRRIKELVADRDDARATLATQTRIAKAEHQRAIDERDDALKCLDDVATQMLEYIERMKEGSR